MSVAKKRRLSGRLFLYWDEALEIPENLKKIRKHRLGVNYQQFEHIQNQLYHIGCIKVKKGSKYKYKPITSHNLDIDNGTYIQILKHLSVSDIYKLFIWKYANKTQKVPSKKLRSFFHTKKDIEIFIDDNVEQSIEEIDIDVEDEDIYDILEQQFTDELYEREVEKNTTIKINDNYTLQNVKWTVTQRNAARNTRDLFLYNYSFDNNDESLNTTMLCDISKTEENRKFVIQIITAFIKAEISESLLSEICLSCFDKSNAYFNLEEKKLENTSLLQKTKEDASKQRTSITDFNYMKKENEAARIIQCCVRRHLQLKRNAVQVIERWWFPLLVEGMVEREVDQRRVSAVIQSMEKKDFMKFEEFQEEIIEDFKNINVTKTKGFKYWLKVYAILTIGCFLAFVIQTNIIFFRPGNEFYIVLLYVFMQIGTFQRKKKVVIHIQTTLLITCSCFFWNMFMNIETVALRFLAYFIIVNISGQYWKFLFPLLIVIRFFIVLTDLELFALIQNEGFMIVHDIYSVVTIVACQRVGDPIEMLHKWMTGILIFPMIGLAVAGATVAEMMLIDMGS